MQYVPPCPNMIQGNRYQSQGAAQAPTISHTGHMGQSMGRGRGQGSQAKTLGTQGRIYAIVPPTKLEDQPVIQGMFMLSCMWARIHFDSCASHSFIDTSCVRESGFEVETLEKPLYVSSPLRTRVSVDLICRGCELEISRILLNVDLRVMYMSEFDVILRIDWLTAHRVVIDCERRRVLLPTYRTKFVLHFRGTSTMLYPKPCNSRCHRQLIG